MCENPTERRLSFDRIERDVLYLLTDGDQPLWTVDDLGRALESAVGAVDAIGGLRRSGLIHQTSDGHVFASRAGTRAVAMTGAVV